MIGGLGHDVLLGGQGDDLLLGNAGRDLLIGGTGRDALVGGSDDDVLIAGWTDHDSDDRALDAIMDEWTSARSYATRINNLRNGSGSTARANGAYYLNDLTVHDEALEDFLTGGFGQDWFFFNQDGDGGRRDRAIDLDFGEFGNDIDVGS